MTKTIKIKTYGIKGKKNDKEIFSLIIINEGKVRKKKKKKKLIKKKK
jgi:hypothetical protein